MVNLVFPLPFRVLFAGSYSQFAGRFSTQFPYRTQKKLKIEICHCFVVVVFFLHQFCPKTVETICKPSELCLNHLRTHLRATSELPPSHLRTTSEPPPNHLRTTSEPLPNHLQTLFLFKCCIRIHFLSFFDQNSSKSYICVKYFVFGLIWVIFAIFCGNHAIFMPALTIHVKFVIERQATCLLTKKNNGTRGPKMAQIKHSFFF